MNRLLLSIACCLSLELFGVDASILQRNLQSCASPFDYSLNVTVYPSKNPSAGVTVCLHGSRADYSTGDFLSKCVDENVVSFNFPEAGQPVGAERRTSTRGTINEVLPAIYVLKQTMVAGNLNSMNIYGFSAGAGTLVNVLAVLNRNDYDSELAAIGVSESDKKAILQALQNGYVIIDCPFKSLDEILDVKGYDPYWSALANLYVKNRLRPIDSLKDWNGLSLTVILNLQDPDAAVSNRDDKLFIGRLEEANKLGTTIVVISHDEGHVSYHPELWKAYRHMPRSRAARNAIGVQ